MFSLSNSLHPHDHATIFIFMFPQNISYSNQHDSTN